MTTLQHPTGPRRRRRRRGLRARRRADVRGRARGSSWPCARSSCASRTARSSFVGPFRHEDKGVGVVDVAEQATMTRQPVERRIRSAISPTTLRTSPRLWGSTRNESEVVTTAVARAATLVPFGTACCIAQSRLDRGLLTVRRGVMSRSCPLCRVAEDVDRGTGTSRPESGPRLVRLAERHAKPPWACLPAGRCEWPGARRPATPVPAC